jgi:hypothetical protein
MLYSKYSAAVCVLVFFPMILAAQRAQENVIPLKNWATPLYWHPNHAESEAAARALPQSAMPQVQFPNGATTANALTFVAITPCRLVDTRGPAVGFDGESPFAGPSITAGQTVTFPVQSSVEAATIQPAPCGTIPATAQAYSLNITVVPSSGAVDYITIWPAGATRPVVSTLDDTKGLVLANAAIVPAGTPSGGVSVYNSGPATTDVIIDMNGFYASPTDLNFNTAIGSGALEATTGMFNTASGGYALSADTTGSYNTASGWAALTGNLTGSENTAMGYQALLWNSNGYSNTAVGTDALNMNSTGSQNTAIGVQALQYITTGSNNIAIGAYAGYNTGSSNSNSIFIGTEGNGGDPSDFIGTIQIGVQGLQTSFLAAGITGVTTGVADAVPVVIDSNGQLGTISSSLRFKEDVRDMGDASSDLLRLRPVTFRYKQPYKDGSKPIDYGLIAEEVADVYPDLVARNKDGEIQTVQYQKLTPMLLNEVQKLHADLDQQNQRAQQQDETIRELQDRLKALETLLRP